MLRRSPRPGPLLLVVCPLLLSPENLGGILRTSSVLGADKIVILERGRIAAMGSHRELMASSPIYREIYRSQLGNAVGGEPHE